MRQSRHTHVYMSRTVSFRCSEELDKFLEEEAERRMTTKSAVAQMIVAEFARDVSVDSQTDNTPVNPPESGDRERVTQEQMSEGPVGEVTAVEFESKERADQIRVQFGEWLDEKDDKRMTQVHFKAETPVEVVEAVKE